jgi:peroxiredoxin
MMPISRFTLLLAAFILAGHAPAAAQKSPEKVRAILQKGPDVGQRAPDFSLPWANRDGVGPIESPYQLASDRGKTVVVAFYPRVPMLCW